MEISDEVLGSIAIEVGKSKGWLKFIGIVTIIGGVLQALTIVGIIFAWLPIWMGILLLQAGKFAEAFAKETDPIKLSEMVQKLRVYFTIQGILMLVSLIISVIAALVMVILLISGMSIPLISNMQNM